MATQAKDSAHKSDPVPTPDELLDRARALVPCLAERAGRAEEIRTLPAETVADLQSAGR